MKRIDFCFRVLLGIVFILFGCSKFYAFMPTPPMTPEAANFIGAIITTGYLWKLVGFLEIFGGILILFNKTTILGLVILSPIIINIILYLGFLQYKVGPAPFMMIFFLISSTSVLAWQRKNQWIRLFNF
ncbi:DoxX family membrane protein [Leptospira congkakensis]|uniref:DoxX family membrane protein n=1 Tax=Leptospira congkakensis TaxID=2484932 RepID=A0A4Z1A591_9LEPT|nr:DoxX family membrane protein [Leptospira congkakensis]TGL87384.1 DoxX family membrane protein [Leptospira congkakensis]TGL96951.1 DoxX family membrane protein [Leptospira congkakensis]TGL97802.1 DoxX family membrane protein [Leptospira congkakensis]